MGDERIELSVFINILEINDIYTPLTDKFDSTHPQNSVRWWEELGGNSRYKHHVYGHFVCKYYNGSPYERCNKSAKECKDCYLNGEYVSDSPHSEIAAESIYNRMNRPEMYLWFVEAFGLLDDDTMQDCFNRVEKIYKEYELSKIKLPKCMSKVRYDLRNTYGITWEKVEAKVIEYGKEHQIIN